MAEDIFQPTTSTWLNSESNERPARYQKNSSSNLSMNSKMFHRSMLAENETKTEDNDIDVKKTLNYQKTLAKSSFNLCDDEKISLGLTESTTNEISVNKIKFNLAETHKDEPEKSSSSGARNYCTLPRKMKQGLCSFHTIVFTKGPGMKKLGFTVVGGTDTGAIGIFIKSILPTGQAAEDGRLKAGDEILAVNGQVCHDLSHEEAVKLFKSVKSGDIALHICRRSKMNSVTNETQKCA